MKKKSTMTRKLDMELNNNFIIIVVARPATCTLPNSWDTCHLPWIKTLVSNIKADNWYIQLKHKYQDVPTWRQWIEKHISKRLVCIFPWPRINDLLHLWLVGTQITSSFIQNSYILPNYHFQKVKIHNHIFTWWKYKIDHINSLQP